MARSYPTDTQPRGADTSAGGVARPAEGQSQGLGQGQSQGQGLAAAFGAFLLWGLTPVYFPLLGTTDAVEILAHRILWTALMLGGLVLALGRGAEVLAILRQGVRGLRLYALTTLLVSTNWVVFIYAIFSGHLLQGSLGYYINPLVHVLLGVMFLSERMTRLQAAAVALAGAGVAVLVVAEGVVPWISFILAFSFGFYALIRKKKQVDPLVGLLVEASLLSPLCLGFVAWLAIQGTGSFGPAAIGGDGLAASLLLVGTGLVTGAPLLLFMIGARTLKLATIGLMQYLAPTLQFIIAVTLFGETLTTAHLVTFACIWTGLALYTAEAYAGRARPMG
ncbi:MAG: EamA family transporter RarD [Azospirillaceae bacterium]